MLRPGAGLAPVCLHQFWHRARTGSRCSAECRDPSSRRDHLCMTPVEPARRQMLAFGKHGCSNAPGTQGQRSISRQKPPRSAKLEPRPLEDGGVADAAEKPSFAETLARWRGSTTPEVRKPPVSGGRGRGALDARGASSGHSARRLRLAPPIPWTSCLHRYRRAWRAAARGACRRGGFIWRGKTRVALGHRQRIAGGRSNGRLFGLRDGSAAQ